MLALSGAGGLGGIVLLCAFLQISSRHLTSMVQVVRISALALAVLALWRGLEWHEWVLWVSAALIFAAQAVVLPWAVRLLCNWFDPPSAGGGLMPVPVAVLIGLGIVALAMASLAPALKTNPNMVIAFAVLLLGIWSMLMQTGLLARIIGFITLENGLILALITTPGLALATLIVISAMGGLTAALLFLAGQWYRVSLRHEADGGGP